MRAAVTSVIMLGGIIELDVDVVVDASCWGRGGFTEPWGRVVTVDAFGGGGRVGVLRVGVGAVGGGGVDRLRLDCLGRDAVRGGRGPGLRVCEIGGLYHY